MEGIVISKVGMVLITVAQVAVVGLNVVAIVVVDALKNAQIHAIIPVLIHVLMVVELLLMLNV